MSICGSGMLTRSLPFLPIISPRLMYFDRFVFTLPRTSLRKRWWSRSIFWPTAIPPEFYHETHERHEIRIKIFPYRFFRPDRPFSLFLFRVFRVFRGSFLLLGVPPG